MIASDEQRRFPRMSVHCKARYRVDGDSEVESASVLNLSGGGVLLRGTREIRAGSRISMVVPPGNGTVPPLVAELSVQRCEPGSRHGDYLIAARIDKVLD